MYFLHYTIMNEYDIGSPESPKVVQELHGATLTATDENYVEQMAFAKANSYNGEVTVEEAHDPEPAPSGDLENRVAAVEHDVADLTAAVEKGLSL